MGEDKLSITRAVVADDELTLYYELRAEDALAAPTKDIAKAVAKGGGFGCPAETILVPRFDGKIRLKDETPAKPAHEEGVNGTPPERLTLFSKRRYISCASISSLA